MNLELPKCSPFDPEMVLRVIGIDPGVNSLGISVYEKEINTNENALIWASTIKGNSFSKMYSDLAEANGERFARLHGYKCFLVDFFNNWRPNYIVCEGNYLGRFPAAYGALTEIVLIIRIATMDYRPEMAIKIIEPSIVKKTIGVPGNTGDKDLIKNAIEELEIIFHQPQEIKKLDEHALDAIAIGYWGVKDLEDVTDGK